jgi:hypothetical protein
VALLFKYPKGWRKLRLASFKLRLCGVCHGNLDLLGYIRINGEDHGSLRLAYTLYINIKSNNIVDVEVLFNGFILA